MSFPDPMPGLRTSYVPRSDYRPASVGLLPRLRAWLFGAALLGLLATAAAKGYLVFAS